MEWDINYQVRVNVPERIVENENSTLHMKLEKVSMKEFYCMFPGGSCKNGSTFYTNITYPFSSLKYSGYYSAKFELSRDIKYQE